MIGHLVLNLSRAHSVLSGLYLFTMIVTPIHLKHKIAVIKVAKGLC